MVSHQLKGKIRWRCKQFSKTKCRAVLWSSEEKITVGHWAHNHEPIIQNHKVDDKSTFSQFVTVIRK